MNDPKQQLLPQQASTGSSVQGYGTRSALSPYLSRKWLIFLAQPPVL